MKKFRTSDDLNQLYIRIPLNKARGILTMCATTAERALGAMEIAKRDNIELGEVHKSSLQRYIDDYQLLEDLISIAIRTSVSDEDQASIRDQEELSTDALKNELVEVIATSWNGSCDDPNCTTCDDVRKLAEDVGNSSPADKVKKDFKLSDLPEGSVIVPGSDEEN